MTPANLLSNAAKFCAPRAGRIDIALSEQGGMVRVDVRDNGAGVHPEDQQVIFDKFRQVGDTLTEKPHGSGLGLSMVRAVARLHGAELALEDNLPGLRVVMRLPAAQP